MNRINLKKLLILNIPYILVGLFATNLGEAWRLAEGADSSAKILSFFYVLPVALGNPLPSFYPLDLLVGIACGAGLRLAVYLKSKNAKKYRHNVEYGSARWGTAKDIEPFTAPKFEDNIILTKTERLMMSNRPKNPANARNKNVLIIGGSGSGKTRFWLKPNLLQMHSSYVVTDPKGSIVILILSYRQIGMKGCVSMLSMKAISEKVFTSTFCFRSIASTRKLWKVFWICWWIPAVPNERLSALPEMISRSKWSKAGS